MTCYRGIYQILLNNNENFIIEHKKLLENEELRLDIFVNSDNTLNDLKIIYKILNIFSNYVKIDLYLKFSSNNQKELSKELFRYVFKEFSKISTICSVEIRNIISIPDEIYELVNLKRLDISFNDLETFPDGICNLINLTSLVGNGNKFTTIPNEIYKLVNLKNLYLNYNDFLFFPKNVCKLKNLEELCIYYCMNKLEIPFEIKNLQKLKYLNSNEIGSLVIHDLQNINSDKKLIYRLFFITIKSANKFLKNNYKIIKILIKF